MPPCAVVEIFVWVWRQKSREPTRPWVRGSGGARAEEALAHPLAAGSLFFCLQINGVATPTVENYSDIAKRY